MSVLGYIRLLLIACTLLIGVSVDAQDTEPTFENSPNAMQAIKAHQAELEGSLRGFNRAVDQAEERFELSAKRFRSRYESLVKREVRDLTREGKLEVATAVSELVTKIEALAITPPDGEGLHFLSKVDLKVDGSETTTKLGVDLLVDIESAASTYQEQLDTALQQYKASVLKSRESLTTTLERVLTQEQQAGRLKAVKEVQAGIEVIKQLKDVDPPARYPRSTEAGDQSAAQGPAYVGYYRVDYFDGNTPRESFFLELTEKDGMIYRQSWPSFKGLFTEKTNWPITDVRVQGDELTFTQHHSKVGEVSHEMKLADGIPTQDVISPGSPRFKTGRVTKLGTVHEDMLGLQDGVYLADIVQHENPGGRRVGKPAQLRIEVERGQFVWTNTRWHVGPESEREPRIMNVQIEGKKLIMQVDPKLRFDNRDHAMVIDMAQDPPTVSHWWYQSAYERGSKPHMSGVLKKQ
jgi:hypothetical protein